MRRIVKALGVDYDQWYALTRVMLRTDFRTTRVHGATPSTNTAGRWIGQGIFYAILGVIAAIFVVAFDDVMLTGTVVLTYVMSMVGLMVLVDHHSVITSTDDYLVLGARPVSSRTYFAVRLTNVLIFTLGLTTVFGALPMLAYGLADGFRPQLWLGAIPAFYLAATFTALALVAGYAGLLRFIGVRRLARLLSYAQLAMGVLIFATYLLPGELVRLSRQLTLPDSPWLLLFPPTWFASYLSLASGSFGLRQLLPAAASVSAIALLARGLGGRLSLDYAERLGAILSASAPAPTPGARTRRPWIFRRAESRVVSLLIRAQFRNDQTFRMAIFGVLPMTVIYMFLSFRDGVPRDPLVAAQGNGWTMLSIAILFFPRMVHLSLVRSNAWRASWIYFGTPVSRARILRAQTRVVLAYFLLPYLVAVAVVMGWFIGRVTGVVVHVLFLGFVSMLLLQVATVVAPTLPFSQPQQKFARNGAVTFWLIVTAIAGAGVDPLLVFVVYPSLGRVIVFAGILVLASVSLDRLTRVRVGEKAERLEFEA